ncbi:hypothetical protein AGLY_014116 [Aphis glycines]|uniref:HTH psq-type domain-containing protein n=1 Tax=Aphis glycines TaxID=307491 RepID=A0A6G0T4T6_APHGL|nr:hypothetical protein AGLY_014116 [Aphis glycines]
MSFQDMENALSFLRKGSGFIAQASREYGIPETSLRTHAVREGIVPKAAKRGYVKTTINDNLHEAVALVLNKGYPVNAASREKKVARTTLRKKLKRVKDMQEVAVVPPKKKKKKSLKKSPSPDISAVKTTAVKTKIKFRGKLSPVPNKHARFVVSPPDTPLRPATSIVAISVATTCVPVTSVAAISDPASCATANCLASVDEQVEWVGSLPNPNPFAFSSDGEERLPVRLTQKSLVPMPASSPVDSVEVPMASPLHHSDSDSSGEICKGKRRLTVNEKRVLSMDTRMVKYCPFCP